MRDDKEKADEDEAAKPLEPIHTIIARNVPHWLYLRLRNVRVHYHARSWTDMLDKITREFEEEIEETEWI